jgi:hypothetical protein
VGQLKAFIFSQFALFVALAAPLSSSADAAGVPASIRHYEPVVLGAAAGAAAAAPKSDGPLALSFRTLGRRFDVELEPSDIFADGARVRWIDEAGTVEEPPAASGSFFRGRVAGARGSWVRLRVEGGELHGIVATDDELYFLEPARTYFGAKAAGQTIAYRLSDTDPTPAGSCAAHAPQSTALATAVGKALTKKAWPGGSATHELAARADLGGDVGTTALVANKRALLGIVADWQYYNPADGGHGANSAADLTAIINAVDGIYQSELGVAMQIKSLTVYSTATDPFSDTADYNALLNEFSAFHDANDDTPSALLYGADLAHLVTGRDLSGSVIGVAWLGTLCGGYWGSGLSQDFSSSLYNMTLLLGHEMGHNFGAPHDNQSGSACANEAGTFIMNPVLSSNLLQQFSPCSKTQISPEVNAATCFDAFTPGPTSTPTPSFTATRTPSLTPTRTWTPTRTPTSPPIGVPLITSPAINQVSNDANVSFAWTAVANATKYDLLIVNNANGATVFTGSLTGNAATSTLISLPGNGSYQFRVRACVNAPCGTYATRNFSISLLAPAAAPSVTFPQPGAVLTASIQTLSWSAVAGSGGLPVFYEVELTNLGTATTELRITVPDPTLSTVTRVHDGSYRLRVRACQTGCGPYSSPVDFAADVGNQPAVAPSGVSPSLNGSMLTVSWNAVAGAEWYQVYVIQPPPAGPGGGALTVAAREVVGTMTSLPIPHGDADVIVAACTGNGCGPFSGSKPADSASSNPDAPNLGTPLGGSVVAGPAVLFTWNRIPGDNGSNTIYRVFVQDLSRQSVAFDVYTTNNFYAGYFQAEGARYDALIVANPGPAQVVGPAVGFIVAGESPTAPTLVQPTHGSTVAAGNVQVGWTPIPGASLYEYYVAAPGQNFAAIRGVTPGLLVQVPLPALGGAATTYSAIARACPAGATCTFGSDANWGPWSNIAGTGVTNFTVTP